MTRNRQKLSATRINYDEWLSAVSEVTQRKVDEVPPGWVTPDQMTGPGKLTKKGILLDRSNRMLLELYRAGRAERRKFMIMNGNGTVRPTYHYRLKK